MLILFYTMLIILSYLYKVQIILYKNIEPAETELIFIAVLESEDKQTTIAITPIEKCPYLNCKWFDI